MVSPCLYLYFFLIVHTVELFFWSFIFHIIIIGHLYFIIYFILLCICISLCIILLCISLIMYFIIIGNLYFFFCECLQMTIAYFSIMISNLNRRNWKWEMAKFRPSWKSNQQTFIVTFLHGALYSWINCVRRWYQ